MERINLNTEKKTFYFYDLETSGINPRTDRIMQFAGRRTDMDLNPIDEPHNYLIKLTDDVLAQPGAVMITGITPQKTWSEGITEAEFCHRFSSDISKPNTIFVGFNSIRFDDEFMRFLFWRNFQDAYEWQWKDGRGRWDILDLSRMTRALRPEGINWPVDTNGKPTNQLEMLASANKLEHSSAHDALSDVNATIAVAGLIKQTQPKLFDYVLQMRDKRQVKKFVESGHPFLYSSGKYSGQYEKTAVVQPLASRPDKSGMFVYDLRFDPEPFLKLSPNELLEVWRYNKDSETLRLPIKSLQYNRCPAISPLTVLDEAGMKRLDIDLDRIEKHRNALSGQSEFIKNILKATELMNQQREQSKLFEDLQSVDSQLYQEFVPDSDRNLFADFRLKEPSEINDFVAKFSDQRLKVLAPLYKARNYPKSLTDDEKKQWEKHCSTSISPLIQSFVDNLRELNDQKQPPDRQYIIDELELYFDAVTANLGGY